jgi:hypothetical protein
MAARSDEGSLERFSFNFIGRRKKFSRVFTAFAHALLLIICSLYRDYTVSALLETVWITDLMKRFG